MEDEKIDRVVEEATFPQPRPHSLAEDIYGLATGSVLMAIGLTLMKASGIVTAGMGGVALLVSYLFPITVDAAFWLLNMPFFILAWSALGRDFFVKSVAAVTLVSISVAITRLSVEIDSVHPAFAALAGGTASGAGILAMLRHKAGVGGVTILSIWLQKKMGWSVGWMSFVLDAAIIIVAIVAIPSELAIYSVLSVAAVSGILIAYHKPGRYTGY
ncbi:YitT family protein [Croceicoccus ponticola]|uniref:YitT family protein n=1 Tax=Croceicoccus ponticola TaxID=2217664 RepID=A0A437H0M0_9SPHN|nr:YitT family protein [Croceicoccus ponticola]RVQ69129.1 YitT family protein [Croceicoccus ponticola]